MRTANSAISDVSSLDHLQRRFNTAPESAEIRDRRRRGEELWTIARAFGNGPGSIHAHISATGGIQPPPRRRSRLALTMAGREEISRGLVHGQSLRQIARGLGRLDEYKPSNGYCATSA